MIVGSPLTPLEDILRSVLDWLHAPEHFPHLTWAWSIVALTLIVRLLLVPLMVKQIHSMQNLQRHAPQMKEIQKKYKADKKRQQEELMKFYKENQINPAASCLPMLAQFPVFIALYLVLRQFAKHPPCPGHPVNPQVCVDHGDFPGSTTSCRTSRPTRARTGRGTCCSLCTSPRSWSRPS